MGGRPFCLGALATASLLAAGCEQNAVFELTLTLPRHDEALVDEGEEMYAFVQARDDDHEFDTTWSPDNDRDYPGTRLTDEPEEVQYSIISSSDGRGLHVKVRFCPGTEAADRSCVTIDEGSGNDRARFYDFEQPFFLGVRTFWEDRIADIPPPAMPSERTPTLVDVCEIRAPSCIDGPPGGHFCEEGTDRHFCE